MGKERRRAERMEDERELTAFIIFPVDSATKREIRILCKDISLTGLRFFITEHVPEGALLKLEIDTETSKMTIIAEVRWVREHKDLMSYEVGVEFINAAEPHHLEIHMSRLRNRQSNESARTGEKNIMVKILSSPQAPSLNGNTFYCSPGDLFKDGLQVMFHMIVPMGVEFEMQVDFTPPPLKFNYRGRVAWIKPMQKKQEGYMLGIEFVDVTSITAKLWNKALADCTASVE